MLLTDWAKAWDKAHGGSGAYTELSHRSRVSYKTILKAARDGLPVAYEVAEKLSAATNGECSIEEIRFPNGRPDGEGQGAHT